MTFLTIAEAVRQSRRERFLTRTRLAEMADVHPTTIKRIELGFSVSFDTLYRVNEALEGDIIRLTDADMRARLEK